MPTDDGLHEEHKSDQAAADSVEDDGVSFGQSKVERSRLSRVASAVGAGLTVIVAIWGAVTGTIALRDDRTTTVELLAAQPVFASLSDEAVVTLSMINRSRHAVVLTRGEIWLEGRKIGAIDRVTQQSGRDDDVFARRDDLWNKAALLPIIIASDTSIRMGALWFVGDEAEDFTTSKLVEANIDKSPEPRGSV